MLADCGIDLVCEAERTRGQRTLHSFPIADLLGFPWDFTKPLTRVVSGRQTNARWPQPLQQTPYSTQHGRCTWPSRCSSGAVARSSTTASAFAGMLNGSITY